MSTLNVNNVNEVGGSPVIASGVLDSGSLPTGTVLQVVSTTKTDTFSTSSVTFTDVTGLSATITPSSTSSKIYAQVNFGIVDANGLERISYRITRNGTAVGVGDAAGNRTRANAETIIAGGGYTKSLSFAYLDSPSSTSALTYQVQVADISTGTTYVNRSNADTDSTDISRASSTVTLWEIAG